MPRRALRGEAIAFTVPRSIGIAEKPRAFGVHRIGALLSLRPGGCRSLRSCRRLGEAERLPFPDRLVSVEEGACPVILLPTSAAASAPLWPLLLADAALAPRIGTARTAPFKRARWEQDKNRSRTCQGLFVSKSAKIPLIAR